MIVEAAQEVFLADGFVGAKTRAIAERSGINEAILYQHFSSKSELFEASVLEPLRDKIAGISLQLAAVTGKMPEDRVELLTEVERLLLGAMLELVPLLGVALFTGAEIGPGFYKDCIHGHVGRDLSEQLRRLGLVERPAGPGRMVTLLLGIALGPALDAHFRGVRLNVTQTARQTAAMLAHGLSSPPRS